MKEMIRKNIFVWCVYVCLSVSLPVWACDTLRVSGATNWWPVAYLDTETKELMGFTYDVIHMVGQELDLPVVLPAQELPWSRSLAYLEDGQLDMVAGIYWTEERAEKFLFTEPFTNIERAIFVKNGHEFFFERLEDLIGKTGGIVRGSATGGTFDAFRIQHNLNIEEVDDNTQSFKKLVARRIDYIPLSYYSGVRIINDLGLTKQVVTLPHPFELSPLRIALSKQSSCADLVSQINDLLKRFQDDGTIERLIGKYAVPKRGPHHEGN